MYAWLWRTLPGRGRTKTATVAVLAIAMLAALWYGVFPWAASHLPIDSGAFAR